MTFWQRWMREPQSVWPRKALFQIHLWTGIGLGLYVVLISLSGSAVVFRNELFRAFSVPPKIVHGPGQRLTDEQIREAASRAHPGYEVSQIWRGRNPDQAVEIWLEHEGDQKQRLFNPYTGEDMGQSVPNGIRLVSWLLDLHDNLLSGETGRTINGSAAISFILLSVTGVVIWWPGIRNWRRSLIVHRKVGWKRFNWDLHSAIGIWTLLFVFLWGLTGVYLSFQEPFFAIVDFLQPPDDLNFEPRTGDAVLQWFGRLHFGRFAGLSVKILWSVLGLVPVALFITGALMWWNRKLKPAQKSGAR